MQTLFTDKIEKLKALNLKCNFEIIDNYDNSSSSIFLIFDKDFNIKNILEKGFIITMFESKYSDIEIKELHTKLIEKRINYFCDLLKNKKLEYPKNLANIEKDDTTLNKSILKINNGIIINSVNSFKGIYIKNILIKKGNIRFIPIYEVIIYIYKEEFSGKLLITQKNTNIYLLYFNNGEITYIETFKEEDNFQFFLKKYGYISKINKNTFLYPIEKQLDIYISNNSIFRQERSIIYKDYITFLFRNIISTKSGDFEILNNNIDKNSKIFSNYFNFLYNFINYFKNITNLLNNIYISSQIKYNDKIFNTEIINFLNEIKNGKQVNELKSIFSKFENTYIKNALYFLKILDIIKEGNSNNVEIISKTINENVSERIKIWLEKIKKENYFSLLGVNINDNEEFIEEKFRNLFSQFSNYLSSEELRIKYKNELEDIIFELESAYNIIKNSELKIKYYNKMLK